MKTKQVKQYQHKSLQPLVVALIALLATVGLLNRSIGSFLTYTFYYLFGTATPLFFIFVIILCIAYLQQVRQTRRRFFVLMTAFLLLTLVLASLFYQNTFPNGGYQVFKFSLVRLSNYIDFFHNPNHLFQDIHGGVIGGGIYASLYQLGGRLFSVIILFILLVVALIFAFWPLLNMLYQNIRTYYLTLKHRNQVIRRARRVPLEQTISPLNKEVVTIQTPIESPPEINYFDAQTEPNRVKRAVFGGEANADSFSFNPVVVDISKAKHTTQEIEIEQVEAQLNAPFQEDIVAEEPEEKDDFASTERVDVDEEVTSLLPPQEEEDDVLLGKIVQQETIAATHDVETSLVSAKVEPTMETPLPSVPTAVVETEIDTDTSSKPEVIKEVKKAPYVYPRIDLLNAYVPEDEMQINDAAAQAKMRVINATFNSFGLGATALSYTIGPSITRFDIKMDDDKSVQTLNRYIKDINIRLKGEPGRFEEVVAGKVTSGFEVPNEKKITVSLRDCIIDLPKGDKYKFAIPFGKNIDGRVIWGQLEEFPHLLVAGSTGSGKSVFVHSLLVTLLMRTSPEELKILIVDPKRVEMTKYRDIPHLLCPIIKETKEARVALEKMVDEMEQRYRLFEEHSANKLSEYNRFAREEGRPILPRIVIVIDEFADIVESEKDISTYVLRIAQKSRAAGIHLIVATQRPSTEIITGTIKANLPTRVALMTASPVDSTVILGQGGAEQLLGNGDMFVDCTQISRQGLTRIQGAYVDNDEIRAVTDYLKQNYDTDYMSEFLDLSDRGNNGFIAGTPSQFKDDLYEEVKEYVLTLDTISINRIQVTFNMAYNRAKNIYDALMADGIISPPDAANSSRGARVIHDYELSPEEERMDRNDI